MKKPLMEQLNAYRSNLSRFGKAITLVITLSYLLSSRNVSFEYFVDFQKRLPKTKVLCFICAYPVVTKKFNFDRR